MTYVTNQYVVCCSGVPVAVFDDEDRGRRFHKRRSDAPGQYPPQEVVARSPMGPFVWTFHIVPLNQGGI